MRRKTDDEDGGLDSLLDTMTNVVGILVIVLVVTQLGVGDAVQRIAETVKIDADEFEKNKKAMEELEKEREKLLAAKSETTPEEDDTKKPLQELRNQIAAQKKILEQLELEKKAHEEELKKRGQEEANAEKREEQIKEARKQLDELNKQWESDESKLEQLKAALDDTPERQVLPPKQITLPNPRPAPEGAQQLTIICYNNKAYALPMNELIGDVRKYFQNRFKMIAVKQRRTFNPEANEGIERFINEVNERPWRDELDYFEVKLTQSGSSPRLVFEPRENGGETEKSVTGARSRFRNLLGMINRNKYFIRFHVCTDSFDIYVTTRRIVSDMGLLAGWEPLNTSWKYTTHLGGDLWLGPRPKPAPKPKTPPQPPKKTKPPNVID